VNCVRLSGSAGAISRWKLKELDGHLWTSATPLSNGGRRDASITWCGPPTRLKPAGRHRVAVHPH